MSEKIWDAWLDRTLPPPVSDGPAPRWMQELAKRHAALSAEVKALYDEDYLGAGLGYTFWDKFGVKR